MPARLAASFCLFLVAAPVAGQLAEQQPPPVPAADSAKPTPEVPIALESAFAASQLRYDRVLDARLEARFGIKQLFRERGIHYPAAEIFLRIFKRERQLEVWVRPAGADTFALLKSYNICALAGELGPKRKQGDEQVPEGFYYIDQFNPQSEYHLSLHVDYPNHSDALLGDTAALGGDIYIHGGCNSIGCVAVTDSGMKEIYWLAVEARGAGQPRIPVHIFPARLSSDELPRLERAFAKQPKLVTFWKGLQPGYEFFEREHRVPRMQVTSNGGYRVNGVDRFEPLPAQPVNAAGGPVPLGTPLGTPAGTPLGTPVGKPAAPPAGTSVAPAAPAAGRSPAVKTSPGANAKKKPVPLGKPVGGD